MKTLKKICALFLLAGISASASARVLPDSLGLPGDNLDLYGVLDLFKKSGNPEEFEKALNSKDNQLNNLDLDGDDQIDYIHVVDRTEKDAHALVLQVAVNEKEIQDVAVIEIEKKADGTADVQIVGDEDLYGKDYIIEPLDEAAAKAPENSQARSTPPVVVNVWTWPSVQYVYRPSYVVWVSPWGWHHYPGWWSPWRPVYYGAYYPHWHPYHSYHHRVYVHRVVVAHNVYYGHRSVSRTVYARRSATAAPTRQAAQPAKNGRHNAGGQQAKPRKEKATQGNQPGQQKPRQNSSRQGGQKNGRRK
jgi:hypothetical protein